MERSVPRHKDELKIAIRRFVVLNLSELLSDGEDAESSSDIVTKLITGYINEALDELVDALKGAKRG